MSAYCAQELVLLPFGRVDPGQLEAREGRMLQTDRYWWVEALLAFGCLVGSIVFPVWYLSSLLPLDQTYGGPIPSDVLIVTALALSFLVITVVFAVMSVRSLQRQRVRMRAIRSHADAM